MHERVERVLEKWVARNGILLRRVDLLNVGVVLRFRRRRRRMRGREEDAVSSRDTRLYRAFAFVTGSSFRRCRRRRGSDRGLRVVEVSDADGDWTNDVAILPNCLAEGNHIAIIERTKCLRGDLTGYCFARLANMGTMAGLQVREIHLSIVG